MGRGLGRRRLRKRFTLRGKKRFGRKEKVEKDNHSVRSMKIETEATLAKMDIL